MIPKVSVLLAGLFAHSTSTYAIRRNMLWKVITHNWPKWEVQNTLGQSVNGFKKKKKKIKRVKKQQLAKMGSREHAWSKREWVLN